MKKISTMRKKENVKNECITEKIYVYSHQKHIFKRNKYS